METNVTCPHCQIPNTIATNKYGTQIQCLHCGKLFKAVPDTPIPSYSQQSMPSSTSTFNDFATFKFMITSELITLIFWIGTFICIVVGLIRAFEGEYKTSYLIMLFTGPFLLRIICEGAIVLFRINATLTEILNKMK